MVRSDLVAERVLATKDTGNYVAKLLVADGVYFLRARYTGPSGSDNDAVVDLEGEGLDEAKPREIKKWFLDRTRGDFDVADMIARAGYDEYGNPIGRGRPVSVLL